MLAGYVARQQSSDMTVPFKKGRQSLLSDRHAKRVKVHPIVYFKRERIMTANGYERKTSS